ncbi:hypothetical protein AB0P17_29495 [Streptomyces sp. NPDC088124]|uniref:hypothetical protein n=1 Tax=Streptomyces sp. NPDC088124 TaxID=3154654 RepID=UPI00342C4FB0
MSADPEIAARFARDTARHQLTVLHADGLYRHLRFASRVTGYSEYWFGLITMPYALVFKGDGEAFVFTIDATRDMEAAEEEHVGSVLDLTFTFSDTWEWQLRDYDWWFLWACHAIVAGIARYDRLTGYGLGPLAAPNAVAS